MLSKENNNSAYNSAKSYNMRNVMDGDGTIRYDQVCLTHGTLTGVEGATVKKDDVGFHFSWTYNSNNYGSRKTNDASDNDQVMLVAYDVQGKQATFITSGARRKVGKESLLLGESYKGGSFMDFFHS